MAKKTETNPILVGVDDGFACTDVVVMEGGEVVKSIAIMSRARHGEDDTVAFESTGDEDYPVYQSEGETWTVDEGPSSESARYETYPVSAMNRAIVHHALRVAGLAGRNVHIATGLPLVNYYAGGKPNSKFISAKRDSLLKPVVALDGKPLANIVAHNVFAEGLAAWVDYAVEGGKLRAPADETVGVIDVGGRTTDCAVVLPGRRIDQSRCGSAIAGAGDIVTYIAGKLSATCGVHIAEGRVNLALHNGKTAIKHRSIEVDFSEHLKEATNQVIAKVRTEVTRRFGVAGDIDRILLVGGGAYLFKDALLAEYPDQLFIPEAPEFANARGFAKLLTI